MPALGAVLKVTVTGAYLGQTFINRFFYLKQLGTDGGLPEVEDFADNFESGVLDGVVPIMVDSSVINLIEVQNIAVPAEYVANVVTLPGVQNTSGMPSFVCWTFYQRRPFPPLRGGYKRFPGVPKEAVNGNDRDPLYASTLTVCANSLNELVGVGGVAEYSPCVLAGYNDAAGTYDLAWVARSWAFRRVGTQNSRKP